MLTIFMFRLLVNEHNFAIITINFDLAPYAERKDSTLI